MSVESGEWDAQVDARDGTARAYVGVLGHVVLRVINTDTRDAGVAIMDPEDAYRFGIHLQALARKAGYPK